MVGPIRRASLVFLFLALALWLVACGPGTGEVPGDEYAHAWDPSTVPECETVKVHDCHGGNLLRLVHQESCVTFRSCTMDHPIRVYGLAQTMNQLDPEWSRTPEFVSELRAAAPHHVRFVGCHWNVSARIALYIGPGVSFVDVVDSSFSGETSSAVVYIDAESTRVTIRGSDFNVDAGREVIAVDGSDHFLIADNRIRGPLGIFTYRNCGENGVTRQTTPSDGGIVRNRFDDESLAVWLSARDAKRRLQAVSGTGYCTEDNGTPIGSSGSDLDWSRRNVVNRNTGGHYWQGYSASGNWGNNL